MILMACFLGCRSWESLIKPKETNMENETIEKNEAITGNDILLKKIRDALDGNLPHVLERQINTIAIYVVKKVLDSLYEETKMSDFNMTKERLGEAFSESSLECETTLATLSLELSEIKKASDNQE